MKNNPVLGGTRGAKPIVGDRLATELTADLRENFFRCPEGLTAHAAAELDSGVPEETRAMARAALGNVP